jgi:predicted phage tail protein
VLRLSNVSGTSLTLTAAQALTPGQSYRWWIGAVNASGTVWTGPQFFNITALTAPVPTAPTGTSTTDTPTFSWGAVTGANHYDLWVDDLTSGQSQFVRLRNVSGTSVTLTAAEALTPGHNFRFYVGAVSTNGMATSWSGAQFFNITALTAPVPTAPTGTSTTDTPTFSWGAVSGANHYDLWVDDLTTGQSQFVRLSNVSGTSVTLTAAQALTPGHSFRFYVGAVSTNGLTTSWSGAQFFSIAALTAPVPSGPSGAITTQMPTFAWGAVAGANHYELWVDDLTTGQSQAILLTNVSGTSVTLTAAQALTVGHSYRWWAGAVSTNGLLTLWSNAQFFNIT